MEMKTRKDRDASCTKAKMQVEHQQSNVFKWYLAFKSDCKSWLIFLTRWISSPSLANQAPNLFHQKEKTKRKHNASISQENIPYHQASYQSRPNIKLEVNSQGHEVQYFFTFT